MFLICSLLEFSGNGHRIETSTGMLVPNKNLMRQQTNTNSKNLKEATGNTLEGNKVHSGGLLNEGKTRG